MVECVTVIQWDEIGNEAQVSDLLIENNLSDGRLLEVVCQLTNNVSWPIVGSTWTGNVRVLNLRSVRGHQGTVQVISQGRGTPRTAFEGIDPRSSPATVPGPATTE